MIVIQSEIKGQVYKLYFNYNLRHHFAPQLLIFISNIFLVAKYKSVVQIWLPRHNSGKHEVKLNEKRRVKRNNCAELSSNIVKAELSLISLIPYESMILKF